MSEDLHPDLTQPRPGAALAERPWGRRLLVGLVALLVSCASGRSSIPRIGPGEGVVPDHYAGVHRVLTEEVESGRSAGVALLVSQNGELDFLQVYGEAELGSGRPLMSDSIFRIYSMTKAMTSVAVMMLWEEGALQLDDPVHAYLPEWKNAKVGQYNLTGHRVVPLQRSITIRDLLRHTSGIPYHSWLLEPYPSLYREEFERDDGPASLKEFSERLARVPLFHQPGAMWTYGAGTDVLGRVVEVASDQSFQGFLRDRLIGPLKMRDTGFWVKPEDWDRFAALHLASSDGLPIQVDDGGWDYYRQFPPYPSGGGGLVSTLSDYLTFLEMLLGGGQWGGRRFLQESTVEMLVSPESSAGGPHPLFNFWSLGFEVISAANESRGWGMEGAYSWSGIARTHFLVDPDRGLVLLLFQQVMPFNVSLRNDVFEGVHRALGLYPPFDEERETPEELQAVR